MLERSIQSKISDALNARPDVRVFRNNVGSAYRGEYRIKFGLHAGSSDLIGWKSITVMPEMIGKKIAVFLSIEVKQPGKNADKRQANWMHQVQNAGGIAGVARSVEESLQLIENVG